MNISRETATEIACAYREIEVAEDLLKKISEERSRYAAPDIRDHFGVRQRGLTLGVPSGDTGSRLFDVPWSLARTVIEAHIAAKRSILAALADKARIELGSADE